MTRVLFYSESQNEEYTAYSEPAETVEVAKPAPITVPLVDEVAKPEPITVPLVDAVAKPEPITVPLVDQNAYEAASRPLNGPVAYEEFDERVFEGICLSYPNRGEGPVMNEEEIGLTSKQFLKLQSRIEPFLGAPITNESIQEIKKEIVQFYQQIGRPLFAIQIPTQDLKNRVLTIELIDTVTMNQMKGVQKK